MDQRSGASASGPGLRLHHWLDPPVLGVALVMAAAGFAQFSPAAALADVAEHFGELRDGETLTEQAGLRGPCSAPGSPPSGSRPSRRFRSRRSPTGSAGAPRC